MPRRRLTAGAALTAATSLVAGAALVGSAALALSATAAAAPAVPALPSATPAWAAKAVVLGTTPPDQPVDVLLSLALPDAAGMSAYFRDATTPGTPEFRHWLTRGQFEQRYAPNAATRSAVQSALSALGVTKTSVDAYGMTVEAQIPAALASSLFGVTFEQVRHDGTSERVALGAPRLPSGLAGRVVGVSGLSEELEFPMIDTGNGAWPQAVPSGAVPQTTLPADPTCITTYNSTLSGPVIQDAPTVYFNAAPMSSYYGQLPASDQPTYTKLAGDPSTTKPYVVSGYTPAQLRGAYGVSSLSSTGAGVSIGIVDAYDGPDVCQDLATFSADQGLPAPSYTDLNPALEAETDAQGNSVLDPAGWEGEQTLDVEAVHQMAPDAAIVFSGAAAPLDPDFEQAIFAAAADGVDQVSNSYGGSGDTDLADEEAWDTMAQAIGTTGTGLEASSGDDADSVAADGVREADFPATSPYTVAVGGTGLEVGATNNYEGEFYWGTYIVSKNAAGTAWDPTTAAADGGGGGGVSSLNAEPSYQVPVVPASETENADTATGAGETSGPGDTTPGRVVPDVSMLGDPATGMLVGETQLNDDDTETYGYYRIGGTSVSSPLFTGVLALADQAAGTSIGFADPALYALYKQDPGAFHDPSTGRPQGAERLAGTMAHPNLTPVVSEVRADYSDNTNSSSSVAETLRVQGVLSTLDDLPGYDDSTGLGSPAAADFVPALAAMSGGPGPSVPEAPLSVLLVLCGGGAAAFLVRRRARRRARVVPVS